MNVSKIPNAVTPPTLKLDMIGCMQLYPLFITAFMIMTSLFNKDVKGLVWLGCIILGVLAARFIARYFVDNSCGPVLISAISGYTNLSISSFFIIFTLFYLIFPMQQNKDWNYYVILGFLALYMSDAILKTRYFCISARGVFLGTVLGIVFSWICVAILKVAKGDKLLYFNTISSNDVYCTKPKKQTFKCYVYKNGEIISAVN
jgi:hypothetical protein